MSDTDFGTNPLYMVEVWDRADEIVHSELTISWSDVERSLVPLLWKHSVRTVASAQNIVDGLREAHASVREGECSPLIDTCAVAADAVYFQVTPIARDKRRKRDDQ